MGRRGYYEKKKISTILSEENYVDIAEDIIKKRIVRDNNYKIKLTTSKIRTILDLFNEIRNDVIYDSQKELSKDIIGRIQYLRLRIIYECGREENKGVVKDFIECSDILSIIKTIGHDKNNFLLLSKYIEALVAYHKFYGGKDN